MFFLLFILFFAIEIYAIIAFTIIVVRLVREKSIPWLVLSAEVICLVIFFYLKYLAREKELVFTGEYKDSGDRDWGAGLANIYSSIKNESFLLLIFVVTQMVFWPLFNRKLSDLKKAKRKKMTTRIPDS